MATDHHPPTVNQDTLLNAAVLENNEIVVRFLLKHGADANARMRSGKQPLQRLGSDPNPEMREIFYRYRSSSFTSCTFSPNLMPIQTGNSYTLNPYTGGQRHRKRSLSSISEKPVKPLHQRLQQPQHQQKNPTPVHVATANGKRDILELLIGHGGDVNIEMEGEYTPLVIAVLRRHHEIVELLVNQGANVNSRTRNGKTPLHFAVKTKQLELVQLFLCNGADVNARTEHGVTPLHIAVERKLQDVAELLLLNGGDVNARTKTGVTALHCAAVKGQREITEMILTYGADVSVIMKKGEIDVTPLLWVTENEKKKITEILHKYVAKSSSGGYYGRFFKKIWKHISGKKAVC